MMTDTMIRRDEALLHNFVQGKVKVVVDNFDYNEFLSAVADIAPSLRWANGYPATSWAPMFNVPYLLYVQRHYSTSYLACRYADDEDVNNNPWWTSCLEEYTEEEDV